MEKQLLELREAIVKQSKPMVAATPSITADRQEIPIWLGQNRLKKGQSPAAPYFRARHELSDSAYFGRWDRLLTKNLAAGNKTYKQNWVNSIRIKKASDPAATSGYTPLHQAARNGTSAAVVERLIRLGAWRLARTVRNGRSQTPLDVAREFGWAHLYALLTPVVHHTLPAAAVLGLQTQLDRVFAEAFPEAGERFCVPQVEVLTELKDPQMVVPLEAAEHDGERLVGLHLFLDKREIVVKVFKVDGTKGVYRVRENGWGEIQHGLLLNYQRS